MARVIFSGGSKGGVGKSVVAATLADILIEHGQSVAIMDADRTNPDVIRFFWDVSPAYMKDGKELEEPSEKASREVKAAFAKLIESPTVTVEEKYTVKLGSEGTKASLLDLQEKKDWDFLLNSVHKDAETDITYIVNLPGGADKVLLSQIDRFGSAMKKLKVPITFLWALSRRADSVISLSFMLDALKRNNINLIVLKNLVFGAKEKFSRFDKSNTAKDVADAGALITTFPEMDDLLFDKIWDVEKPRLSKSTDLEFSEQMDIEIFLAAAKQSFASLLSSPSMNGKHSAAKVTEVVGS